VTTTITASQLLASTTPTVSTTVNSIVDELTNSKGDKQLKIRNIVNSIDRLSDKNRRRLHAYLLHHQDCYDFVDNGGAHDISIDTLVDEYSPLADVQRCVDEMLTTVNDSQAARRVLIDCQALHIPQFVEKSSDESVKAVDIKRDDDDDILDELESGDFPLSAPHTEARTPEFIQEKLDAIKKTVYDRVDLDNDQKTKLYAVLSEFEERFSLRGENMGVAHGVEHEIETEARPFRQRLRNYSQAVQMIIDREVTKLLELGVIVPSRSPYASNVVVVSKPDASAPNGRKDRMCIDYVELNSQTRKDSYPLPNIQTIFNQIGQSTWFTTMDLLNGFWQVMLKPEHRHKTAFLTMRGLFEWITMPFGLCNAPPTFQRLMDTVIKPEYRAFIETYIDDLMTHSTSFDDHIEHLRKLLTALTNHNLTVKLSKCKFAQREVKFLGHIISHQQVKMNPDSVQKILDWQRPKSGANGVKAIRGFLGMAGWYRKFIKNFSHIAKPLFELTKKNQPWVWSDACESAFQTLRDAIVQYPVLRAADPNKDYVLETDASDDALSATILQHDENNDLHPVAFASKTLNSAQRNYTVTDREALAIVWGLEHFNSYCEGHRYTAITDHAALRYLYTSKNKTPRLHRLLLRMQPYEVKLHYRKGEENHAADLLSRTDSLMETQPSVTIPLNAVSTRSRRRIRPSVEEYEVERVLSRRPIPGRADEYEYLVKWKGYGDDDNSWEPVAMFKHASEALTDFERRLNEKTSSAVTPVVPQPIQVDAPDVDVDSDVAHELVGEADRSNTCDICDAECKNRTDLYVHRFREHKVPVPIMTYDVAEIDRELLLSLQRHEPQFRIVFDSTFGAKELPHATNDERRMMSTHEFVVDADNLLHCIDLPGLRTRSRVRTRLRLCLPKQLRRQIMKEVHEGVLSAHPGVIHMNDKLRESVWWPRMLTDVIHYVKNCEVCQRAKSRKQSVLPRSVSIPYGPWTHVGLDHVGPLPMTERGNQYILIEKCKFIKYVEGQATDSIDAKTTAHLVINNVILRHGLPVAVTHDRGKAFVAQVAASIFKILGIKQSKTTSFHAASNGDPESFNKVLKQTLKIWSNERQTDWDILLPYAIFAYNTAIHSLLQETPFYLDHGRDARLFTDAMLGRIDDSAIGVHEYAMEIAHALRDVHDRIRDIMKEVNAKRDEINAKESLQQFAIGDEVLLYDPTTKKGLSRKLVIRWKGPYVVLEQLSSVTYKIMRDGSTQVVHVERLRPKNDYDVNYYQTELESLETELKSISETRENLIVRQKEVELNKDKVQALIEAQQDIPDNDSEEIIPVVDDNAPAHDDALTFQHLEVDEIINW
jgi:hypothetical protein